MFERLTENSRRILSLARQEAVRLQHDGIAPEHLFLGLLQAGRSAATSVLQQLGADCDALQQALAAVLKPGTRSASEPLPFTPTAKAMLEAGLEEAARSGHKHLGSEHLLLGVLRVETGLPAAVLGRLGIDLETVRAAVADSTRPQPHDRVRLLLISNSTMHGGGYLAHCAHELQDFLGTRKRVLFVPYALHDHDGYARKAQQTFAELGHDLVSLHTLQHDPRAVADAEAVFVGGGNTFRLLTALYHYGLLAAIQQRALDAMPYVGSSAGTNVATLSIRTTNDMPIVQPPSFTALQLVPFQINPHYLDPEPASTHMGETREERLRQFHEEHATPVLGLREGCLLRVEGRRAELRGTTAARLFRRSEPPQEFLPPCDLSFLLQE